MHIYDDQKIFGDGRLYDYLEKQKKTIIREIDSMAADKFNANSYEEMVAYYMEKYSIDPLKLDAENKIIDDSEISIDVSQDIMRNPFRDKKCFTAGMLLKLIIPYTGDPRLWRLQPDRFSYPSGSWPKDLTKSQGENPDDLVITFQYIQDSARSEQIDSDMASEIATIQSNIDSQNVQLTRYHSEFGEFISQCIGKRKEILRKQNNLLESLSIPLKPKEGMPDVEPIKVKKRNVPLQLKATKAIAPEPGIDERIFQDILAILRFMGRTFEETAKTFAKLEEEDLRNVFLAALNGYFEGQASGETFRKNGKTDICVSEKDKEAFVAECKIWHGQKSVANALDQLLKYLTWRDCKTSMIIFNKGNTAFSKILTGIPYAIRNHRLFIKELEQQPYPGEWRFVIKRDDDADREIILHIFAFDL